MCYILFVLYLVKNAEYFIKPIILELWKARESYQNRIYYQSQIEPKSIRPFKYLFSDNKFIELYKKKENHIIKASLPE